MGWSGDSTGCADFHQLAAGEPIDEGLLTQDITDRHQDERFFHQGRAGELPGCGIFE